MTGLPLKREGEVPVFSTYLGGQRKRSPSRSPTSPRTSRWLLAKRHAQYDRLLVKSKGLTREQAYVLTSVTVDLNIAQVVDVPNVGVTAILNRDVFKSQ